MEQNVYLEKGSTTKKTGCMMTDIINKLTYVMESSISNVTENVMDGRINKISGCIMDGSTNIMNLTLGVSLCFMILNKYLITVLTTLITLAISSSNYAEKNEWNKMYILRNFSIINTQKIAFTLKLCHVVEISIIL